MRVEFFRHNLGEEEIESVVEVLKGRFLTTGEKNREFEEMLSDYLEVPHVLTTSSCTSALHLSLMALGIGRGDKVIVPALTFMATANVVVHVGATPLFVDVDRDTGLMDLNRVEDILEREKVRAVIPVHLYGQMVDMEALEGMAQRYGFRIIEDSAHNIEGFRRGIKPGQKSDFACFSFYATKNITSGEGGAVAFRDGRYYDYLRMMRVHGMSLGASERYGKFVDYDMPSPGWKYNMTNFQAAMLIPQLKKIESLWSRRRDIAERYYRELGDVSFPKIIRERDTRSAYHLFGILVENREEIARKIVEKGIGISSHYSRPVPYLQWYRETFDFERGDFPNAEYISDRIITLPLYPSLTDEEQDYVIEVVKGIL